MTLRDGNWSNLEVIVTRNQVYRNSKPNRISHSKKKKSVWSKVKFFMPICPIKTEMLDRKIPSKKNGIRRKKVKYAANGSSLHIFARNADWINVLEEKSVVGKSHAMFENAFYATLPNRTQYNTYITV